MKRVVAGVILLLSGHSGLAEDPAILYQEGRYQEAVEELQARVSELEELAQPEVDDQRELFQTLLGLGMSYQALNATSEAISAYEQAKVLAIRLDFEITAKARVLDSLARAQQQAGQLAEAEANFRASLALHETDSSAEASYWHGVTRDHLGLLLLSQGNYREAGELLAASLSATAPEQKALLAQRHHYLARYLHSIRNYHRAATHARKSLEIGRAIPELDLASYLDLLALSLYRSGDQTGAETALLEALEILRRQPVTLHRARGEAEILNKVGEFALHNAPTLAQSSFREALDGLLAWLPENDPSLAVYHNNLGLAAMELGQHEEAEGQFQRALAILEEETKGLKFGHQRRAEWKQNLAWNALFSGNQEATTIAVKEACDEAEAALQHLLAQGTEQERLNFLAHFDLYSLPACAGEAELLQGLLHRNKGFLLDSLISRVNSYKRGSVEGKTLLPGSAFVDYVRYQHREQGAWSYRYGAIVVAPGQTVRFVPLGSEKVLIRWLKVISERLSYRALLIGNQKVESPLIRLEPALRQLHEKFLEPILRELPENTTKIALAPDGSLHFAPFAAFLDKKRNFLGSGRKDVFFLSSYRDLWAKSSSGTLWEGGWHLFGMSQFDELASDRGELSVLEELSDLPHVAKELSTLKELAPPGSRHVLNPERPEEHLKSLPPSPAVLHLATHAFFVTEQKKKAPFDLDARPEILLRSGLALSAADEEEDGILYPHEIARMPLEGTRLVSLSACHTGMGTPLAGEGVLGLRRAFALAGARSLLLTLWQVPDQSTADFMVDFYREAMRHENPSQALWRLQGKMLAREAGHAKDDAALEEAVLRYGPFLITHQGPLPSDGQEEPLQTNEPKVIWMRYLLWLVLLGGSIFLLWYFARKSSREKGHSSP